MSIVPAPNSNEQLAAPGEPVNTQLARPDFLKNRGVAGIEGAKASDLIFPRLLVMQPLSEKVAEGKFAAGDIVRSDTNEILVPARASFHAVPVAFQRCFIHWGKAKEGMKGKTLDEQHEIAIKAREQLERLQKTGKPLDRNSEESYVESHDWLLVLPNNDMVVIGYAKGTIMCSRKLISTISAKQAPSFSIIFKFTSDHWKKPKGSYWVADPKMNGWVTHEQFAANEKFVKSMQDGNKSFAANVEESGAAEDSAGGSTGVEHEV